MTLSNIVAPSPTLILVAGALWPPMCAIVVALRFYTRRVQRTKILIDDWLTIPALIFTIGLGATLIIGVKQKALGYPTPKPADLNQALTDVSNLAKVARMELWAFELVQIPALACVKLSFIYFYRRIFVVGTGRPFNLFSIIMIILTIGWAVSFEFALLFICRGHISAWWGSIKELKKHCRTGQELELGFAISDFIMDLIVLIMPMPLIWKLQMSIQRRLAIVAIFCFGSLTVAASITKMVVFIRAVEALEVQYKSSGSNTRVTSTSLYWSMIESGLGLISACLPTIYALGRHNWVQHSKRTTKEDTGSTSSEIQFVPKLGRTAVIDTHIMKDLPYLERHDGQIHVEKTIDEREEVN